MKSLILILPMMIGFIIDLILGDPYSLPHPIRFIGLLISRLEKLVRSRFNNLHKGGIFLAVIVLVISTAVPLAILIVCYKVNVVLGVAVESVMCWQLVAARCLQKESMKVYYAIKENDVEKARKAVSMIVGRDTDVLDETGIIKAAVETVAENTSDGVTAPIMYIALGGAALGFFTKQQIQWIL